MGTVFSHWRVYLATGFSVAFVLGAYFFARGIESPSVARASTETALLQAIASKDSDHDGLPDWEEALYGTDPHNPDTFHLGMTDGQAVARGLIVPKAIADVAVATSTQSSGAQSIDPSLPPAPLPGTLTDTFAKNFFASYISAKQQNGGANLTTAQTNAVADQVLSELSVSITQAPAFKTNSDITVSGTGADALITFAKSAGAVLVHNTGTATTSEIFYLQNAIQNNDLGAISQILDIAKVYRATALGISALPVPQELATADLALMNALMRMGQVTGDFAKVQTDPLVTMLALKQYPQAVLNLGNALIAVHNVYVSAHVSLPKGSSADAFANLIMDIAAEQKAHNSSTP